jgi:phage terminase large subunit-like protein
MIHDLDRAIYDAKAKLCEKSYYYFFKEFWGEIVKDPLEENWHLELIADELQKLGERIVRRDPNDYDLLINVPPGMSKSTLVTQVFPVWLWIKDPKLRIITGSNVSPLSVKHGTKSRDIIASEKFKKMFPSYFWIDRFEQDFYIRRDFDNKLMYMNSFAGERIITSVRQKIIGNHAHLMIVDDPIDPEGVKNTDIMTKAWDWINKRLETRKADKKVTSLIMVMQRLHVSDPSGMMIKQHENGERKILHICLPATLKKNVKPESAKKKYVGGLLDVNRLGYDQIEKFKLRLGSVGYGGQFDQSPKVGSGNHVKDWMLPVIPYEEVPIEVRKLRKIFVVDSSDKVKDDNDPTGLAWGSFYKGHLFIWRFVAIKKRFSQRLKHIKMHINIHGGMDYLLFIEPKSSGVGMTQYLQDETSINTIEYEMPRGDKLERMSPHLGRMEAKRVYLIESPVGEVNWTEKFKEVITTWPRVDHDEEWDNLAMLCQLCFKGQQSNGYNFFGL